MAPTIVVRYARALVELPEDPLVLVLLVATDGARWLPETLRSLRSQQHRPIDILAVDNASTDGSGALLSKALGTRRVITLERRVGYGRALTAAIKVAADRGVAPDAFLILHDDCAMDSGAIGAMLGAMRRDGVGIVGAKLHEWEDPTRLLEVGQTTDRYGRIVPRIDRGELDQGQHDGVHDVMFTSSAVMLVARRVVEEVGLFDPRFVAMRDDLDFCWRARLAGHATVVTTDASARHAVAGARDLRDGPVRRRVRYFTDRNVLATLIKNYGSARLALIGPIAVVLALASSVLYFLTGRRRAAVQALEALQWNVAHLPSTLRARHLAQSTRRVDDQAVTALMHHGATRLRARFERAVEIVVGEVDAPDDGVLDRPPPRITDRFVRHPGAVALAITSVFVLIGARAIFFSGPLAGADIAPFPDTARAFFSEFASGWRGAAHGGAAPASPGLVLLGMLTFVCFGSAWLAQRVLLLGLPLMGVVAIYRLVRALGAGAGARTVAAVCYGASPLLLGTYGAGRMADLVLLAAAPSIAHRLLRAAGVLPWTWRDPYVGAVLLALAASLAPWIILYVAATAIVVALLAPEATRLTIRRVGGFIVIALALLFPWSVELLRSPSPLFAGGADSPVRMQDLVGLAGASVRPMSRFVLYGLPFAAFAGAIMVIPQRRRSASILTGAGMVGLLCAWGVGRGADFIAPRAAQPLVASAVAACVLAALAFDGVKPKLGSRAFGLAHVATGLVGLALIVEVGAAALWVVRADVPGVVESGSLAPSFFVEEAAQQGAFRVAWFGGSAREPQIDLTGPAGRTMTEYLTRSSGAGAFGLRRVVASIAGGATSAGGKLLATFGVRYVIVRPGAADDLRDAIARQVDLAFAQTFHGAAVYRNETGLPTATGIASPGWITASAHGFDALPAAEAPPKTSAGFRRNKPTEFTGTTAADTRHILLAEDFSKRWTARAGKTTLEPARSFGWATRFVTRGASPVTIRFTGQRMHRVALLLQLAIVLAFVASWSQRGAGERGER